MAFELKGREKRYRMGVKSVGKRSTRSGKGNILWKTTALTHFLYGEESSKQVHGEGGEVEGYLYCTVCGGAKSRLFEDF